jgi:hypothetical protein
LNKKPTNNTLINNENNLREGNIIGFFNIVKVSGKKSNSVLDLYNITKNKYNIKIEKTITHFLIFSIVSIKYKPMNIEIISEIFITPNFISGKKANPNIKREKLINL